MGDELEHLVAKRMLGSEPFHYSGKPLGLDILGFWQWSASNLLSNAARGVLAEYIVACALGVADGVRATWEPYDLDTEEGVKVEVKSSASPIDPVAPARHRGQPRRSKYGRTILE